MNLRRSITESPRRRTADRHTTLRNDGFRAIWAATLTVFNWPNAAGEAKLI
jgi:hypothetical protein